MRALAGETRALVPVGGGGLVGGLCRMLPGFSLSSPLAWHPRCLDGWTHVGMVSLIYIFPFLPHECGMA